VTVLGGASNLCLYNPDQGTIATDLAR
jgi:hypothetical protein